MKTITFYLLDIEPPENANFYHQEFKNSLILATENSFYFKSHFKEKLEKINYQYGVINLNNSEHYFSKLIAQILENAYLEAKSITKENMGFEIQKGSIKSSILLTINEFTYYTLEDNKNFFDLVTKIFIKILMTHHLDNGNKRLALCFLKRFLWEFGYYLKWTKGMYTNYYQYKNIIEEFVAELENKEGKFSKKQQDAIYWYISNCGGTNLNTP